MAKTLRTTNSNKLIFSIYAHLNDKERTPEEEEIYTMIDEEYGEALRNTLLYYYKLNKSKAKVSYSGFYGRVSKGWSRIEALTTPPVKENSYNENRPKGKTMKEIEREEREEDIINMLKAGVALNRRQLKYIESNPEFAKRLKKEGIS